MPFRILSWEAWAGPDLATHQTWRDWAATGAIWTEREPPPPPLATMPPLLRRRTDGVDRYALGLALRLAPEGSGIPTVFASRHGKVARSTAMLRTQAAGEPASPADFSHSVHNAAAALHSMATGNRAASSSLSARGEELPAALLEAQGLVLEGAPRVLVVVADPPLPEPIRGRVGTDADPGGYALALLLAGSGGSAWELALSDGPADPPGTDTTEPAALIFLRALASGTSSAAWRRAGRRWDWTAA